MEKSLSINDRTIAILPIDEKDRVVIKKSEDPCFYADDVDIELVSGENQFLVNNDSFEFSAFPEIIGSIQALDKASPHSAIHVVAATCARGGLALYFVKLSDNLIELQIVEEFVEEEKLTILYTKAVSVSILHQWKQQFEHLWNRKLEVFGPNYLV